MQNANSFDSHLVRRERSRCEPGKSVGGSHLDRWNGWMLLESVAPSDLARRACTTDEMKRRGGYSCGVATADLSACHIRCVALLAAVVIGAE